MMALSLDLINSRSPYLVKQVNGGYEFTTDSGVRYRFRFLQEDKIGGCDTYQFAISKLDKIRFGHDPQVSSTTFAVIDEFFRANQSVLLYYCDATDHREASRSRLFIRWFEKGADPIRFTIRTAHVIVEGQGIYVAIIVENNNPKLKDVLEDFDSTAASLTEDKPQ